MLLPFFFFNWGTFRSKPPTSHPHFSLVKEPRIPNTPPFGSEGKGKALINAIPSQSVGHREMWISHRKSMATYLKWHTPRSVNTQSLTTRKTLSEEKVFCEICKWNWMGCAHPYSEELDGASCVRRFDDSLSSAIRKRNRSLLRSSSMRKPRHPLPRVVQVWF